VRVEEFVERYKVKNVVCCFSGGKDSLVATHLTHESLRGWGGRVFVVTVDTTVMLPPAIPFVEKVAGEYGWDLHILQPEKTFWVYAPRKGSPTIRRRWCCYWLKLKPIYDFVKRLNTPRSNITGMRRQESIRRRDFQQIFFIREAWCINFHPLIDWSDQQVDAYIKHHNLPEPPWYRLGVKETCMCGAYSYPKEMMIVRSLFPDFFQQFIELERKFKKGGTAFYFHDRPYSAREFLKQRTLEEVEEG